MLKGYMLIAAVALFIVVAVVLFRYFRDKNDDSFV